MDKSENTNCMLPTLSVLISSYNYERYIGGSIESVLKQSYRPKEVILVDDKSTDGSVDILEQFVKQDPIVRLIKNEKNIGIINVLAQFLSIASGDYIFSLGADDRILPGFFEKSMKLLARYPEAGLCSTLSYKIDEKDKNMGFFITPIVSTKEYFIPTEKAVSIVKKIGGWVPGNAVIFKRKALDSVGGFKPELGPACDAVAAIIIACKYGACFIPEALSCMRVLPDSYSARHNEDPEGKKELRKAFDKLHATNDVYKKIVTSEGLKQNDAMYSYMINTLGLSNLQNEKIGFLKEHMLPKRFLEKVLYILIKIIAKVEKLIYHLYAFAHSERKIYPVIYNRLFRSLRFRMLYFIAGIRRKLG